MKWMKSATKFDKKFLTSLCVITAIDLFFLTVNTGFLGELILMFTIPLFMLVLYYDLSMMTIYEIDDSDRGKLTYIAGTVFVHLMDLRTILVNNKGVYAWGAPTFEKVEVAPVLMVKALLLAIGVFTATGFADYSFPRMRAEDWKGYLREWMRGYVNPDGGYSGKREKQAIVSNVVYWVVTGFSAGYAVTRLLILTGAMWFADTRPYSPRGDFKGLEPFLIIGIGSVITALGIGAWINGGCKKGRIG